MENILFRQLVGFKEEKKIKVNIKLLLILRNMMINRLFINLLLYFFDLVL